MTAHTTSAETRRPREIPVRRLTFDFSKVKHRRWFGGDPFLTHLLNALSLTFPEGERFFMDSVRHYLGVLEPGALRHEVSRFLAQEAMHGRAHEAFNEWVRSLGLDTAPIEEEVARDLKEAQGSRSPIAQLAITCALEHFTAILAELMFVNEDLRARMDPEIGRLWLWHAVEETEHKAVAFDTYAAAGGSYGMRVGIMALVTLDFVASVARYQARLMKSDPEPRGSFSRIRGLFEMWVAPGTFRPILPAYFDYYRPSFHPWQRKPKGDFDVVRDSMNRAAARNGE